MAAPIVPQDESQAVRSLGPKFLQKDLNGGGIQLRPLQKEILPRARFDGSLQIKVLTAKRPRASWFHPGARDPSPLKRY